MAKPPPVPVLPPEPETKPRMPDSKSLLEDEKGSIDKLLALTDEGWDIDEQVKTLQRASGDPPSKAMRVPTSEEMILPSADDLAPAPRKASIPPPLPNQKKKSLPPPLPLSAPKTNKPPPLPSLSKKPPPPLKKVPEPVAPPVRDKARSVLDPMSAESIAELLAARIATLETGGDKVGLTRAHLELAVVLDAVLADEMRAASHAELALVVDPGCAAAHNFVRTRLPARSDPKSLLKHIDAELAAASTDAARVALLVLRARLLDKSAALEAWQRALAIAPDHPAALRGLEGILADQARLGDSTAKEAFAAHLARMADAYAGDAKLAAWFHVERARILEHDVQKVDAARSALERALELDGSIGPVRDACVRFVASQDDASALASLLEEEALLEKSRARAARLDLDAACLIAARLGDAARATALLERAMERAPTEASIDRRVLDELLRAHEAAGTLEAVARVRRARLAFVTDPAALAQEHRALAALAEKAGTLDVALNHIQSALALASDDATVLEQLDRLLAAAGKQEQRMVLWVTEAARNADGTKRGRALLRAAHIADELGRRADGIRHLRAAWIANPGDVEVLDALSRALSSPPSDKLDGDTRALLELYVQAAERARDNARRVAYLEKAALLWEEVLGDASRAIKLYDEILALEPTRRGAILGAARCAERLHDDEALARALLAEARLAEDGADVLALKTRAAGALGKHDPARALGLVEEVIAQDQDHAAARAQETRLHEEAGRWEKAAASLRARIDAATRRAAPKNEVVALWLALAQIQRDRLRALGDALASLKSARVADPSHPVPPIEIARLLESTSDHTAYRDALYQLADTAQGALERADFLVRAAEVEELELHDDARAAATYARALVTYPDNDLAADRLERVLGRRVRGKDGAQAAFGELFAHTLKRSERALAASPKDEERSRGYKLAAAALLVESSHDVPRAVQLLDAIVKEDPAYVPALRMQESLSRAASDWPALAQSLSRQGDASRDKRARLGALWALVGLEETRLQGADGAATFARILELDPGDVGALEATLRRDTALARRGDPRARKSMQDALRALAKNAPDDGTRLVLQLRLALTLEAFAGLDPSGNDALKEAHELYRSALAIDKLSVTAATGLARLSARLGDATGALTAALSLADVATQPAVRARYLVEAAELLLGPKDGLGAVSERRARAGALLQRAVEADPNSIVAAGRLSSVWTEDGHAERLVDVFRTAIKSAAQVDAIIMLGSEIARVARDELKDLPTAIEAMQRVRAAAPDHIPSLLTLSELCIAQRAWAEATGALEAVVATSHEPGPRLTALFALASVYERVLDRGADAERALRTALSIEPMNPRALRALLRHLAAEKATTGRKDTRTEQAQLLEQLADVEPDHDQKAELLGELSMMRARLGDLSGSERALIAAIAHAPRNPKLFAQLTSKFKTPQGVMDDAGYARALEQLVAVGQRVGQVHASWVATLGQLEVEKLARVREGIAHLQHAVTLDPTLTETRYELAVAYSKAQGHQDVIRTVMSMLSPDPRPLLSLADPAAALGTVERSLNAERRGEEALAVSELRAVAGDLDDGRYAWLRGRRPKPLDPNQIVLDRATLVTHILPPEGRHVLLEVAAAIYGIESRMLRSDIGEIGISARDRISSRVAHPTRILMDRGMRMLGLEGIELIITPNVPRTRVLTQDVPWIVVPASLVELPEMAQLAAIGRALARIAFGAPWLEELPGPHIEALLVAAARHAVPSYARDMDLTTEPLIAQYEGPVAKTISRKQRKLLEELASHIASPQGRPLLITHLVAALARGELRTAYVMTGDLLATIDDVRGADAALLKATEQPGRAALAAVLEHPYAGDVARFATTPEAAALKRRLGTSWA